MYPRFVTLDKMLGLWIILNFCYLRSRNDLSEMDKLLVASISVISEQAYKMCCFCRLLDLWNGNIARTNNPQASNG